MHPTKVFLCLIGLTILGTEAAAIEEGSCTSSEFACATCDEDQYRQCYDYEYGVQCIPAFYKCDGINDCWDASDESVETCNSEEHLGVGASHEFFYNVGLMSHNGNAEDYTTYTGGDPGCCQKCDKRFGPGRTDLYNYKFNHKYEVKWCECFRGPSTPERQARIWSKRSGNTIGYCGNNSTFVDQVDGTFGDDRSFYSESVESLDWIWNVKSSDLCCEKCSNKSPESQMFEFGSLAGNNYCSCYKEIPGKRPETFGEGTYNGFCANE